MPTNLERLTDIEFKPAGNWRRELRDDGSEHLCLDPTAHDRATKVLYALVVNGQVMYVGKTTRTFVDRMRGYCKPGRTQFTNIRNRELLLKSLRNPAHPGTASVYILHDQTLRPHGEFTISLAAGLEDSIIETLKPAWNGMRSRGVGQ